MSLFPIKATSDFFTAVQTQLSNLNAQVSNKASELGSRMTDAFNKAMKDLGVAVVAAANNIANNASSAWNSLKTGVIFVYNGASQFLFGKPSTEQKPVEVCIKDDNKNNGYDEDNYEVLNNFFNTSEEFPTVSEIIPPTTTNTDDASPVTSSNAKDDNINIESDESSIGDTDSRAENSTPLTYTETPLLARIAKIGGLACFLVAGAILATNPVFTK